MKMKIKSYHNITSIYHHFFRHIIMSSSSRPVYPIVSASEEDEVETRSVHHSYNNPNPPPRPVGPRPLPPPPLPPINTPLSSIVTTQKNARPS